MPVDDEPGLRAGTQQPLSITHAALSTRGGTVSAPCEDDSRTSASYGISAQDSPTHRAPGSADSSDQKPRSASTSLGALLITALPAVSGPPSSTASHQRRRASTGGAPDRGAGAVPRAATAASPAPSGRPTTVPAHGGDGGSEAFSSRSRRASLGYLQPTASSLRRGSLGSTAASSPGSLRRHPHQRSTSRGGVSEDDLSEDEHLLDTPYRSTRTVTHSRGVDGVGGGGAPSRRVRPRSLPGARGSPPLPTPGPRAHSPVSKGARSPVAAPFTPAEAGPRLSPDLAAVVDAEEGADGVPAVPPPVSPVPPPPPAGAAGRTKVRGPPWQSGVGHAPASPALLAARHDGAHAQAAVVVATGSVALSPLSGRGSPHGPVRSRVQGYATVAKGVVSRTVDGGSGGGAARERRAEATAVSSASRWAAAAALGTSSSLTTVSISDDDDDDVLGAVSVSLSPPTSGPRTAARERVDSPPPPPPPYQQQQQQQQLLSSAARTTTDAGVTSPAVGSGVGRADGGRVAELWTLPSTSSRPRTTTTAAPLLSTTSTRRSSLGAAAVGARGLRGDEHGRRAGEDRVLGLASVHQRRGAASAVDGSAASGGGLMDSTATAPPEQGRRAADHPPVDQSDTGEGVASRDQTSAEAPSPAPAVFVPPLPLSDITARRDREMALEGRYIPRPISGRLTTRGDGVLGDLANITVSPMSEDDRSTVSATAGWVGEGVASPRTKKGVPAVAESGRGGGTRAAKASSAKGMGSAGKLRGGGHRSDAAGPKAGRRRRSIGEDRAARRGAASSPAPAKSNQKQCCVVM